MIKNISITLIAVMVCAFLLRVGSFEKKHPLTYDETVYFVLASQLMRDPGLYNTKVLYNDALKKGRRLPAYFNKPLFKHPPMFPAMVAVAFKLFGESYMTAFRVSLFFGILLIPLAYLLGSLLFDKRVGAYASALMAIEPIGWICSQKIWMETALTFFMVLSLYLFILFVKKGKPYFMIASGIATGFAVLTKYPGILTIFAMLGYVLLCERKFFKDKIFLIGIAIPFVMLVPWIDWNIRVYGTKMMSEILGSGKMANMIVMRNIALAGVAVLAVVGGIAFKMRHQLKSAVDKIPLRARELAVRGTAAILFIGVVVLFWQHVLNSWNINNIPETGFRIDMFANMPYGFFPWRVLELSPMYLFAYAAIVIAAFDLKAYKEYLLLLIYSATVMMFWSLWDGAQCRYILGLAPTLMVLSSKVQFYILDMIRHWGQGPTRKILQIAMGLVVLYAVIKTVRVDMILAVPNTACYF